MPTAARAGPAQVWQMLSLSTLSLKWLCVTSDGYRERIGGYPDHAASAKGYIVKVHGSGHGEPALLLRGLLHGIVACIFIAVMLSLRPLRLTNLAIWPFCRGQGGRVLEQWEADWGLQRG